MERYDFKDDFTNSVFRLMGRILLIVLVVQLLTSLLNLIFGGFIVDPSISQAFQEDLNNLDQTDPAAMMEEMKSIFIGFAEQLNFGVISIAVIISLLISYLTYSVIFNGIKNEVGSGDNTVGSALNNILDTRVIKYLVLNFLITIATVLVLTLFGFTGSVILIFIAMLFIVPIAIWFTISMAAVGIDNVSIGKALSIASSNLSMGRIFKVLGIGIVVFIVLAIASVIIGLLTSMFDPFSIIGRIMSMIVGLALGVPLTAFLLAGFAALYYRYTDSHKKEEEFLVTD